jgi:hypothetical protein
VTQSLREQLIGAWTLVSHEERPVDGSPSFYPMSEQPVGIIMYTPDGYMSAQLMKPGRTRFASGDWFRGTPDEYDSEATTYVAYSGPFPVDEAEKSLSHSMVVSLFPNWIGQTQPRIVTIDGDMLRLRSASPIYSGGRVSCHICNGERRGGGKPNVSRGDRAQPWKSCFDP